MDYSIPWIEKYRPTNISDVMMDEQTRNLITGLITNRKNMHIILTGLPGVGKTSTVKCIAKALLGDNIGDGYLELNDADGRGVRSTSIIIPTFCKKSVNFTESKIILMDEADNLTEKCQYDICDIIKTYGHNTKFIFTCNDSNKIIEDIQSICRIIRFRKLTDSQIKLCLQKICEKEKIKFQQNGLDIICYISMGDMRKAINNLQMTAYSFNAITKPNVLQICKLPDPVEINKIIDHCMQLDLANANNGLNTIIMDGYYHLDIVTGFGYVLADHAMNDAIKLKLLDIVNQTKITISIGNRSKLQLVAMICRMIDAISKNTKPKKK